MALRAAGCSGTSLPARQPRGALQDTRAPPPPRHRRVASPLRADGQVPARDPRPGRGSSDGKRSPRPVPMVTRALTQHRRGLGSQGGVSREPSPPGTLHPVDFSAPGCDPSRWGGARSGRCWGPTRKALRVWWAVSASSRLPRCISRCSLTRSSCWALGRGGGSLRAGAEAGPALGGGRAL